MKGWKKVVAQTVCATQVVACASQPSSIDAKYVSPVVYQNWTCAQLIDEQKRLDAEVRRISGLQQENADADVAMMGVGLILFWPALFGLAATKDRKEELGKLKGEYEAVDQQMKTNQCAPPEPAAEPVASPAPVPEDAPQPAS
jgi:hypothetical protein